MKYKQSRAERETLFSEVMESTLERMKEITGGEFLATFGDEQETRKPEYNLKYATGPMRELVDQYNKLIDDAQYEINGLHRMLDSKKLDISKLVRENNRFLTGAGSKTSWKAYEQLLANERTTNERLQDHLAKKHGQDKLLIEGAKTAYEEYAA